MHFSSYFRKRERSRERKKDRERERQTERERERERDRQRQRQREREREREPGMKQTDIHRHAMATVKITRFGRLCSAHPSLSAQSTAGLSVYAHCQRALISITISTTTKKITYVHTQ